MGKEIEFLNACKEGNVVKVEHLLASKSKKLVPFRNSSGKAGSALLSCKDTRAQTPLHHAVLHGRKAVVYMLLDQGADVTILDIDGYLPIHLGAKSGHTDIVSALIARDFREETINAESKRKETPLQLAAQQGYTNVVSLLLRNGAHAGTKNEKGETALDLAAKHGRCDVVRCLLDSNPHLVLNALTADPLSGDATPPRFSALHLAAKHGRMDVVRTLLDAGFDVNLLTEDGSALHIAALHGKVDVVKLLLQKGINADARDFSGLTVLEMLKNYQAEKSLPSHLMPNRDAWQSCSNIITEHLDSASIASTASKEIATIYMNASSAVSSFNDGDTMEHNENAVWLPIPTTAAQRANFAEAEANQRKSVAEPLSIQTNLPSVPPDACSDSSISLTPTSTLTAESMSPHFPLTDLLEMNFRSKIASPTGNSLQKSAGCNYCPVPMQYDNVPAVAQFPATSYDNVPTNLTGYDNAPPPGVHAWTHECGDCAKAKLASDKTSGLVARSSSHSTLETSTLMNVTLVNTKSANAISTTPGSFPTANSANSTPVNSSTISGGIVAEFAKPMTAGSPGRIGTTRTLERKSPELTAAKPVADGGDSTTNAADSSAGETSTKASHRVNEQSRQTGERLPMLASDLLAKYRQPRQAGSPKSTVKFAEAPPETLYLPVEAKLYSRMAQPFTPPDTLEKRPKPVSTKDNQLMGNGRSREEPVGSSQPNRTETGANDGPAVSKSGYDNVATLVKRSPDVPDDLIKKSLELIEQSTKDMEHNVQAIVRCPSGASLRSSRPVTPCSPKHAKFTPPISPKILSLPKPPPVFVWPAPSEPFRAPLAQEESDDLGMSTDSMEYSTLDNRPTKATNRKTPTTIATEELPDKNFVVGHSHRRSVGTPTHLYVDGEAQADVGGASECGSICTCSAGSQCSLLDSTAETTFDERISIGDHSSAGNESRMLINDVINEDGTGFDDACDEKNKNTSDPVDEQAEWKQIEDIFKSCGTRMVRLSVFDREVEPIFTHYLQGSHNEQFDGIRLNHWSVVERWLESLNMHGYSKIFSHNGFDRLEYFALTLEEKHLRQIGVSNGDVSVILNAVSALPEFDSRTASAYGYVSDWLHAYGCQDYLGQFVTAGYDSMLKVLQLNEAELNTILGENARLGHRLRLLWSMAPAKEIGVEKNLCDQNSTNENQHVKFRRNTASLNTTETCSDAVRYSVYYLGSTAVSDQTGAESTRLAIEKLKRSVKTMLNIPQVILEISFRGVRFFDFNTHQLLSESSVRNIQCICQDERDLNCFAYVTRNGAQHFCHVFSVLTVDVATDLILTLGKAFEAAYDNYKRTLKSGVA